MQWKIWLWSGHYHAGIEESFKQNLKHKVESCEKTNFVLKNAVKLISENQLVIEKHHENQFDNNMIKNSKKPVSSI